jgi:hypothetical protein
METKMKNNSLGKSYLIESNVMINAPLSKVWQVLSDFNDVYTWAPTVTHSSGLDDKINQVGAGRHCTIEGFGSIVEVLTQWEENKGFTYTISDLGPLTQGLSRWTVTEESQNKVSIKVEFGYELRFSLFGKLMHKLVMRRKLEAGLPDTLKALKTRVESGKLVRPLLTEKLAANL